MDNPREKRINVLMLPWLAHGHANRYLELAKRLTQELKNLSIHFCSTPIILDSIRDNLHRHSTITNPSSINLVEICLQETEELPPHLHTTRHLPLHLIPVLKQVFAQSEETFLHLLETLKPDLLIFDIFQPWAAKIARQRNIPAVVYIGCTVAMSSCAHDYFAPSKDFPYPAIKLTQENRRQGTEPSEGEQGYRHFLEQVVLCWQLSDFVIARSFREIEAKYIDYLSTLIGKELVLTGPLIPDVGSVSPGNIQEAEKVMQWLDQREPRSVVFVSFGSQCFMPYNEMEQLARGLELSGACFIWVARFPKNNDEGNELAKALLHGLVERVGPQRGLVITSWAPQRRILLHRNLSSFLTHCGWSSVLEGMHAGVPMLALPMESDQPVNAKLIVDLGIGIEIPQHGRGNFKGEGVSACIKQILQSEYGDSVRRNAQELAEVIRNRKNDDIRILADKILELASDH
ncbi:crocetin glucoside glucosyltransferase-like protein [Carex littledalei]|uniref:Crocetin glucoside glucosyltransferase-like protein n=1 Tax=Carex littledalei TaxID=544730 RepID=A0A833VQY6_9POAL|nr:crocetin glucoside glucosyltransferase-like protein [Carex littledalei]